MMSSDNSQEIAGVCQEMMTSASISEPTTKRENLAVPGCENGGLLSHKKISTEINATVAMEVENKENGVETL